MTTEEAVKKTQFDTVEVYFHPPTISNNPGSNLGPSIELDWKAYGESKLKLDTYEQTRPGRMQQRKSIYMSHLRRECMLREANYSDGDIKQAIQQKNIIIKQRQQSILFMNPIHKVKMRIDQNTRDMKIHRAKLNLEKLAKEDGSLFHDHDEIYDKWWHPDINLDT